MRINHVLVRTSDLEVMNRFLVEIIGLEPGKRPPFPFPGSWFYSEGTPLVHVMLERSAGDADGAVDHVALEGADYDTLITTLNMHDIHYVERDVPQSGEHQVFIFGPDGLKVEMMFPAGFYETQFSQNNNGDKNESYRFV